MSLWIGSRSRSSLVLRFPPYLSNGFTSFRGKEGGGPPLQRVLSFYCKPGQDVCMDPQPLVVFASPLGVRKPSGRGPSFKNGLRFPKRTRAAAELSAPCSPKGHSFHTLHQGKSCALLSDVFVLSIYSEASTGSGIEWYPRLKSGECERARIVACR